MIKAAIKTTYPLGSINTLLGPNNRDPILLQAFPEIGKEEAVLTPRPVPSDFSKTSCNLDWAVRAPRSPMPFDSIT